MTIAQRDVVPSRSDQDYLLELWKGSLVEMMADVSEAVLRCKDASQTAKAESMAAIADARAASIDFLLAAERKLEERLGQIRKLIDDKHGPAIRDFEDGKICYAGELIHHLGSTWQCRVDTARPPSDGDDAWQLVAAGGLDGRSLRIRGTYQPGERYAQLDVCIVNSASFVARRSTASAPPGQDWQLLCGQGKRGQPGPKGDRGERGPAGATIRGWKIEPAAYLATPIMGDGTQGPPLELRWLFEQFHSEAS